MAILGAAWVSVSSPSKRRRQLSRRTASELRKSSKGMGFIRVHSPLGLKIRDAGIGAHARSGKDDGVARLGHQRLEASPGDPCSFLSARPGGKLIIDPSLHRHGRRSRPWIVFCSLAPRGSSAKRPFVPGRAPERSLSLRRVVQAPRAWARRRSSLRTQRPLPPLSPRSWYLAGGYRRGALDCEAPRKALGLPGGLHPPPRERAPPGPTRAHDRRLRHWLRPPGGFPSGRIRPRGAGFAATLCEAWEAESRALKAGGSAVCCLRLGLVLGPHGGLFGTACAALRLGLGGRIGAGDQGMSWIHRDDVLSCSPGYAPHRSYRRR